MHIPKVRHNLRRMVELIGSADKWRPHLKTTKMAAVWGEALAAGVRHFKCATTRECELLLRVVGERAVDGCDVLLAYPLVGPSLVRLGQLSRAHPNVVVSCLVECEDAVAEARGAGLDGVFVDINPGMNRTAGGGASLTPASAEHHPVFKTSQTSQTSQ